METFWFKKKIKSFLKNYKNYFKKLKLIKRKKNYKKITK